MRHSLGIPAAALAAVVSAACARTPEAVLPTEPAPVETASQPSLATTTWRLVSIDGREALAGVTVTAVFDDQSRVAGSAGCNRYVGNARVDGEQIQVGLLASTRMFCNADGVMSQEADYLAALEKAASYRVVGSELRLGPTPGAVTLVFKPETAK